MEVRNFLPGVGNVLGVQGDFDLELAGTVHGETIQGTAKLVRPAGIGIAVKLTRRANLP